MHFAESSVWFYVLLIVCWSRGPPNVDLHHLWGRSGGYLPLAANEPLGPDIDLGEDTLRGGVPPERDVGPC